MIYFEETQYFRQKWLWAIILFFPLFSVYGIYEQILMGNPIGTQPISNSGLLLFSVFIGLGLPFLFFNIKLKTRVSDKGLHYRFFPIHLKEHLLPFEEIESLKARKYAPLKEFGGWGIRWGFEGKAYNVSGEEGLQLVLKNDLKILFGSQQAKALEKAMKQGKNA
jgi:hypothetical protein